MEHICVTERCTGCSACYNKCPKNAITMEEDKEGFLRPYIALERCVDCGICIKTCPVNFPVKKNRSEKIVYACWSKNNDIRKNSTSGGLFSELAGQVLQENGVVYGAALNNRQKVVHIRVDDVENLRLLRGSKYVQSCIGYIYQMVEKDLKHGRQVLFSGTACQIAGLYRYLPIKYATLITCDVICHGVPSPKILDEYLKSIENKYNSAVDKINFRDKSTGWFDFSMKIWFSNGRKYRKIKFADPYTIGFLSELYLRPSCHTCSYVGTERVADLTIADFWGYRDSCKEDINDNRGVSLCMINSKIGRQLFEKTKDKLCVFERSLEDAVKGNRCLREPYPASPNREAFWITYKEKGYKAAERKFLQPASFSIKRKLLYSWPGILYKRLKNRLRRYCLK